MAEAVEAKAEGNALCAARLATVVRRDGLDVHEVTALPGDIGDLYLATLRRRFQQPGDDWASAREIFEMIAVDPHRLRLALDHKAEHLGGVPAPFGFVGVKTFHFASYKAVEPDLVDGQTDALLLFAGAPPRQVAGMVAGFPDGEGLARARVGRFSQVGRCF